MELAGPGQCLICFDSVLGSELESSPRDALHKLSRVLKVSETINECVQNSRLPAQIFCKFCQLALNTSITLLEDIEQLKRRFEVSVESLTRKLVTCYYNNAERQQGSWVKAGKEASVIQRIRRAYAQCWGPCYVKICGDGLSENKADGSTRSHGIPEDLDTYSEIEDSIGDDWDDIPKLDMTEDIFSSCLSDPEIKEEIEEVPEIELEFNENLFSNVSVSTGGGHGPRTTNVSTGPQKNHGKPYSCDICHQGFTRPYGVRVHKVRKHGDKQYQYVATISKKNRNKNNSIIRQCLSPPPSKGEETLSKNTTEGKSYKCDFCCKSYTKRLQLNVHIKLHHKDRLPRQKAIVGKVCNQCGKTYTRNSTLRDHIKRWHSPISTSTDDYQCRSCSMTFSSVAYTEFLRHKSWHSTSGKCHCCDAVYENWEDFEEHLKGHINDKNREIKSDSKSVPQFLCEVCCEVFQQKREFQMHSRFHQMNSLRSNKFKCPQCPRSWWAEESLERHKQIAAKVWLQCPFCELHFPQFSQWYKHRQDAHVTNTSTSSSSSSNKPGKKPFHCIKCNQVFSSSSGLQVHMKYHETNRTYHHNCKICSKIFKTKPELAKHVSSVHEGNFLTPCRICKLLFRDTSAMKEHFKQEHPEAMLNCELCGETFLRRPRYNAHLELHNGSKDFPCNKCSERFDTAAFIMKHNRDQHSILFCVKCSVFFDTTDALWQHRKDAHRMKVPEPFLKTSWTCPYCPKVFSDSGSQRRHLSEVHPEDRGEFQCSHCTEIFRSKHEHETHLLLHPNGQKDFQCLECAERFPSLITLGFHIKRVHRAKTSVTCCRQCDTAFASRREFIQHRETEHGYTHPSNKRIHEWKHDCPFCEKKFVRVSYLRNHLKYHNGRESFNCGLCSESFPIRSQLRTHMAWHEVGCPPLPPPKERNFTCNICSRKFFRQHNYELHLKRHADPEGTISITIDATLDEDKNLLSFSCKACQLTYTKSEHLNPEGQFQFKCQHGNCGCGILYTSFPEFLSHHKIICTKQFFKSVNTTCQDCGKTFSTKDCLKSHVAFAHPKTNRYKCEVCDRGFDLQNCLTAHLLTHATERQHQCELCGASFKHPHGLKNHMECHGEKGASICEVCGKGFTRRGGLKDHMVTHMETAEVPCPLCGKLFRTERCVRKHISGTHEGRRKPCKNRARKRAQRQEEEEDANEIV